MIAYSLTDAFLNIMPAFEKAFDCWRSKWILLFVSAPKALRNGANDAFPLLTGSEWQYRNLLEMHVKQPPFFNAPVKRLKPLNREVC